MTNNFASFHYAFQISRMIIFEVDYYRCGNNPDKYFTTSAAQFNRPKTDYNHCGQAQKELLRFASKAMTFFKKWDDLHTKDLNEAQYLDMLNDIEVLKSQYNYIVNDTDRDLSFSELRDLSKLTLKRIAAKIKPRYTPEEKELRRKARSEAREAAKEEARIASEKAQKPVKQIKITIEWKKSRTWGNNPACVAEVTYLDGGFEESPTYRCSGCGYDKESTVIADVFNNYLKYKLWQLTPEQRKGGNGSNDEGNAPYGISLYRGNWMSFSGGIGTSCYYAISEYLGGKFERISSGKTFDVYLYTDLGKQPGGAYKEENPFSGLLAMAKMGELLANTQEEKNTWKARMLKAGLGDGLSLPEDWDSLSEDEKEKRLNGAIDQLEK
jgi:hypothetical protein